MKNGKSQLRKPPELRAQDAQLLERVNRWTEEPARIQANSIAEDVVKPEAIAEVVELKAAEVDASEHVVEPAVEPAKRKPAAHKPVVVAEALMPWEEGAANEADPVNEKQSPIQRRFVGYRLPDKLYHALRWLGDTTYNESATTIVIQAMEDEVNSRMKKLGKPLIQRTTPLRK